MEGPRAVQVIDLDLPPPRRTAQIFSKQDQNESEARALMYELSLCCF